MTRILVTGAAGFIGSHLVRRLSLDGYRVRAAVRRRDASMRGPDGVEVIDGDLTQPVAKTLATGCDVVVHLAGKAHAVRDGQGDAEYAAINVDGTRNVLQGAVDGGVRRVIFASSVKVFGEGTTGCVDESIPPAPTSPYGRSKLRAEELLIEYGAKFGLETVSLRLPLVYGPTDKGNLYRMLAAIDRGWFPPLVDVHNRRSMLHVENLVQAISLGLTAPALRRPCYIVTDAVPYSVSEIYQALRAGLGHPAPRWRVPVGALRLAARCGDLLQAATRVVMPFSSSTLEKLIGSAWYSTDAFRDDLGYRPALTFQDAVPGLIAAYRAGRA